MIDEYNKGFNAGLDEAIWYINRRIVLYYAPYDAHALRELADSIERARKYPIYEAAYHTGAVAEDLT